MQQAELQRDYFFEFAGMPQSGKSTVEEIVAHYLKGQGYVIEEFRGGSRYSPLRSSSISDLNMLLACKASEFVLTALGREKSTRHKIFLLDRGLIDRYMFTDALLNQGKLDEDMARATKAFLTVPRLLQNIDGVFIFATTTERALSRENYNKLVPAKGEVMNETFLNEMRSTIENDIVYIKSSMPDTHVQLIDTHKSDGQVTETADNVVQAILKIIHKSARRSARM